MRGREPPVAALQHRLQDGEAAVDGHEGGAQPVLEQREGPVVGTVAQITVLIGEDHLMRDAISMQSACNQNTINMQSACNQHAITVLVGEDYMPAEV